MDLLGAETKAPSWPNVASNTSTKVEREKAPTVDIEKQTEPSRKEDIQGKQRIWVYEHGTNFSQLIPNS